MKKALMFLLIMFCLGAKVDGKNILLTLSGTDTIFTNYEYGFDFINQIACTTFTYSSGYDCNNHIWLFYNSAIGQFEVAVNQGYGIQEGKINLDSIYTAPPDTSFKLSLHIDSIPQDSISDYVGNSYIFKTGVDPRDASIYFAKIRIVGFRLIDSATHTVEMRFIWACNVNGSRDIATSGLDTFNLPSTGVSNSSALKPASFASGQRVFKVVGDRFIIPKELIGSAAYCNIYNLNGRMLGRIPISNKSNINLKEIRGVARGVLIARFSN